MVVGDGMEDGDPFKTKPRCTITCLLSQGRLSLPPMALCLPEPGLGATLWGTHGSVFAGAWVETPPGRAHWDYPSISHFAPTRPPLHSKRLTAAQNQSAMSIT